MQLQTAESNGCAVWDNRSFYWNEEPQLQEIDLVFWKQKMRGQCLNACL